MIILILILILILTSLFIIGGEEEYLKNDFCKFNPMFKFDPSIKKNLLISVLFKMPENYKSFDKYIRGLKVLIKHAKELDFTPRVFIDNSIPKKIMKKIKKLDIEYVKFECSAFLSEKYPRCHKSTFGSMVRFFPMFDFPNNDADKVIISDLDITEKFRPSYQYNDLVDSIEDVEKYAIINNGSISSRYIKDKYTIRPYIIGNKVYNFKKMPNKIITDFLKTLREKVLYEMPYEKSKERCEDNICYGVDERFLNYEMVEGLYENNIPYYMEASYNIAQKYYHLKKRAEFFLDGEKIKKLNEVSKELSKNIEGDVDNYLCNIFYKNIDDENNKIATNNFYKLMEKLRKNNDYSIFTKDDVDLALSSKFFGVHSGKYKIIFDGELSIFPL